MSIQVSSTRIQVPDTSPLQAHFLSPSAPIPGILFIHGWGGDQRFDLKRAQTLASLGCLCLTFDLTGHHEHEAERNQVTRAQNLQDVCLAYDKLSAHPLVDPQSIAVVGHSYGAYLATLLSQLRTIRWLSLLAPALYQDDEWLKPKDQLNRSHLATYRQQPHTKKDNQALMAGSLFQGDVLLLEAEHDHYIPKQTILNYRNSFTEARSMTHRIIHGADHALTQKTAQHHYSALLYRWAQEMITGARTGLLLT